jgi:hypothetical protein
MKPNDLPVDATSLEPASVAPAAEDAAPDLLRPLLQTPARSVASGEAGHRASEPVVGVVVGTLLALTDQGHTALVAFPGQPGHEAQRARTTVDLHGAHIGAEVTLMFERGDVHCPIVMGVLRQPRTVWPQAEQPATVEVDADGQRMVVTAQSQLVLRCGEASITLTQSGKVLIDGTYVLSRSRGVNRIKGGSVQLN